MGSTAVRKMHPPQQLRSRKTLDRMLDATEALLADRTFEELTIGDVVRRSRASVGAFYARFSNKDALFDAVYDRHQRQRAEVFAARLASEEWRAGTLAEMVGRIVHQAVDLHRKHRGLLRALVLRGYIKPDWRYKDPKERGKLSIASVGSLLAKHADEIDHPDPKMAAKFGYLMVLATLREKMLFGESTASAMRISDRRLEKELVRAYLAYLGAGESKQK